MNKTFQGFTLAIIISIALSSCNSHKQIHENLPVIDIEAAYQQPPIKFSLSAVVDHIEYIKLETNPACMIARVQSVAFSKNYIALYATPSERIMLFTKEGKYLHDIGGFGKGPGEYSSIYLESLIISPDEKYIAFRSETQIYLFKLDGSFQNSITIESGAIDEIVFDQDGSLAVYRQKLYLPDGGGSLIMKYDNHLTVKDSLLFTIPDKTALGQMLVPDRLISDGNDLYYLQVFNDTVWKINKSGLIAPVFTVNLGTMKLLSFRQSWADFSLKYLLINGMHLSDQYFFIQLEGRARKREPGAGANEFVWFHRRDQDVVMSSGILTNDMDGVNEFWIKSSPKNGGFWDAIDIISAKSSLKEGSVKVKDLATPKYFKELKEILAESDIEDNPIIRILYLK